MSHKVIAPLKPLSAVHVLIALTVVAACVAGLDTALFMAGSEASRGTYSLWGLVFSLLVATWVDADSRGREVIYRPFEFGWLVFVTSLLYLPYYLWRTRGFMGIALLVWFLVLYTLGFLLKLALWFCFE